MSSTSHHPPAQSLRPVSAWLSDCAADAKGSKAESDYTAQRIGELIEFIELSAGWADRAQALSPAAAKRLCQLGDKVFRLVG